MTPNIFDSLTLSYCTSVSKIKYGDDSNILNINSSNLNCLGPSSRYIYSEDKNYPFMIIRDFEIREKHVVTVLRWDRLVGFYR